VTREDRLLDIYAQTNPVPDPDRFEAKLRGSVHLATLEQGSEDMQGTDLRTIGPRNTNTRGPWIFAAAAGFVAVLAVGALIWTILGDNAAGDPAAPTTEAAPADDEAAIGIVLASIAARNSGDWDAWLETLGGEELAGIEPWRNQYEANAVANYEAIVNDDDGAGCQIVGTGLSEETLVRCDVIVEDDFLGAGGVVQDGQSIFYVLDGKVVQWDDGLRSNDPGDFETAFLSWLSRAHPDVANGMTAGIGSWYSRTSDDMATVLDYVDEFVAQSDIYPIGG
jgi:hypothetical protein